MVAQGIEPRILGDRIFCDSLLEASWAQRSRRSWTTLTSFGLEALAIAVLLVIPLWKTVGLPSAHTVSTPVVMMRNMPISTAPVQSHGGTASPHPTSIEAPDFCSLGTLTMEFTTDLLIQLPSRPA